MLLILGELRSKSDNNHVFLLVSFFDSLTILTVVFTYLLKKKCKEKNSDISTEIIAPFP
jgi:hypothetical protein